MIRLPIRGGNWNNGSNAGVFALNLNNARSNANTNIGFRSASGRRQKGAAHGRRLRARPKGSAIPGPVPKIETGSGGRVALVAKFRPAVPPMPITFRHLYPLVYDFQNLHAAYGLARRGKRYHRDAMLFRRNLEGNLIEIQNELIWKTYRTGRYHFFDVFEPKRRLVAALPFRDRVVQHALVRVIEPIWESRFIADSYACRRGKGTHAGADRAQDFLRRQQRGTGRIYALKADISSYFHSIDHAILKSLLRRHVACRGTLWLLDSIIDSTADRGSPARRGVPIGNLTSQLFANIYLHELDLFIKHDLQERFYLRYMDDFCVIGGDKAHLHEVRRRVEEFLSERLALRCNRKTQIFPVSVAGGRGLDFLGYRIWPTHRKLRKTSGRRMLRGLKRLAALYRAGEITFDRIQATVDSWLGHCAHCNSYGLRKRIFNAVAIIHPGAKGETS